MIMKNVCIRLFLLLLLSSCSKSVEQEVMCGLMENYSKNHTDTPFACKAFINEYSKMGEEYLSFNDGVYYFVYYGDDYEIVLGNYTLISDNVRKLGSKEAYIYYTKNITDKYAATTADFVDVSNISEISDIPFSDLTYGIIRRLETNGPLSKKYKKYNYKIIDSDDSFSTISFEPVDSENSSLSGTIVYDKTKLVIESISVFANTFENVINDWTNSMYDIKFDNGELKSITMKSQVSGIDIIRNMKLIPNTRKTIDISKFNVDMLSYFRDNNLIVYDSVTFKDYAAYFEKEYEAIFNSFAGVDQIEEKFMANNNTLFINKNYQNKNEKFESKLKYADSTARNLLDSIYGRQRKEYRYMPAVSGFEYQETDLKIIDRTKTIGKIKQGEIITTEFKIINTGENKLHLFDIKPDCDCTTYSMNKNGVNSLDTLTITLKLDTKDKLGKNNTNVIFQANTNERIYKIGLLYETLK